MTANIEGAIIRKDGDKLIIESTPPRPLLLLDSLAPLNEEISAIGDSRPEKVATLVESLK